MTTTGGGTCTTGPTTVTCTGVTVPATGTTTVSIPVTLAPGVTAGWAAASGAPVTATSGDSTGTASGPIITADPRWTLGVTSSGPAPRTVRPGQTATMTVTVSDTGPSDARDASFGVRAPTGTTYGTRTGAAADCTQLSPTTLRCTADIPVAGPALVLTLPLVVSPQADPATPLADGCVSLNNDDDCADPGDVALATIQLRTPLADRLSGATTAATIVPGTQGSGKVGLTSTQTETGLTVTVPLGARPAGFTVTGATVPGGSCAVGPAEVTCTGVDLTAGARKDVSLQIAVASSVTPPLTWTATGIVVFDGGEQLTVDGALASAGTPAYGLSATVTGPADNTVLPGDTTSITVVATNTGPSDAPAASFTVTAPTGTTFGTPTGPAATVCTIAPGGTTAVCTLPLTASAASAALVLPIVVPGGADPAIALTGGCVDLGHNGVCGDPDDIEIDEINLRVPFNQRVTVTATPATVTPGDDATATLRVNAIHGDLSGLTVTVPLSTLPAGLTVTAATSTAATCTVTGTTVECTGLSVTDGQSATITLTVAATSASTNLTWTATGVTVDGGPGDQITAAPVLATTGAPAYDLDATVTVPAPGARQPGQVATIGVELTNDGPSDATAVTVGVNAPVGTTFEPLTGATATDCQVQPGDQRVTCLITLAAGASTTYSFPVLIDAGASPAAPVTGGCVDLDNSGTCTAPPADRPIPDIWLATPLSQRLTIGTTPGTVVPGRTGTGRITLQSTRPENDLTVTVPTTALPAGFTATGATAAGAACTVGAGAITCTGVDLTATTPLDVIVTVAVAASVVPPAVWTATGIDVADAGDHHTGSGAIVSAGTPASTLSATVTGPADGTVTAGDTTTLTVVATNEGPSVAAGQTFTVTPPAGTTFGALTGAAATACPGSTSTLVTCTVSLGVDASTPSLSLPLIVDAGTDPFTPLTGGCVDLDGVAGCGTDDTEVDPIALRVPFDRRARIDTTTATVTPGTEETTTAGVTALHGALSGLTVTVPLTAVPAGLTVTTADPACTTTASQIECTGLAVADQATTLITLRVRATPSAPAALSWSAAGITVAAGSDQITATRPLAVTGPPVHPLDATVTPPAQPILPGGTGTLTVAVDNLGPSDATQQSIGVIAPSGTTFGTRTGPAATLCPANAAGTVLTCTFDLTAAAPPLSLAVPVTVGAGATEASPPTGGCVDLDNSGTCTDPPDEPMPPIAVATPFAQQVAVTTTPATIAAGQNGTGRVVVTTDRAQSGLTVVIPLGGKPGDVFIGSPSVSPSGTCTADATAITCTGVDLAAGGAATVAVPLSVSPSAPANLTWTAAGVTVTSTGGDTVTGSGLVLQTGPAAYRITAVAAGPAAGTVLPGGTAQLTLTLDNTGPSDATGAPVTVQAPVGTTFAALTGAAARDCTVGAGGTRLTCAVTLAVDDEPRQWTLPVAVPGNADPQVALTGGCADLAGDGACGGADDVALPDISLRAPLSTVLTVSADDPAVTPGTTGTATVSIAASQARTGLTVRIDTTTLPSGLTVTAAGLPGATCTLGTGTVECTGVDLTAGGRADLALTLRAAPGAPAGGTWQPAVTILAGGETVGAMPQTATVGAPVHPVSVAVAVPAAGTVLPGGTADLAVDVTNGGPSAHPGAAVAIRAPNGTTFATPLPAFCSLTSPGLADCTLNLAVETRSFTLAVAVPPGADPAVVLTGGCVDVNRDGACTGSPDQAVPGIQLATPLGADLALTVEPGTAVPGGPATTGYLVVEAAHARTGLTVTVPRNALPAGFTITGAAGPTGTTCALTPAIVCTGVDVTPGKRRVIAVTATAAANLGANVTWTAGPITVANAAAETVSVTGALISTGTPATTVSYATTAPAPGTVEPGGTATLTVTVTNAGPSDATGQTTSILAPAGTTFGPLSAPALTDCTPAGPARLNCAFNLAANAPARVWSIPVQVPASADPTVVLTGGCLDTAGDGTCGGDDPLPGITLRRTLAQALTVSADNPTLTPGRTGTAVVTVASADARTGLTVAVPTGTLPAGVTATTATIAGTPCTVTTTAISCPAVSITAGGSATLSIGLTAAPNAVEGAVWTPAITVTQSATTITRPTTTATVGAAETGLTATVVPPAPGTVLPGGVAGLAVTVSNAGPSDAAAQPVRFQAPTGTTFTTPLPAGCTVTTSTLVTCTVTVAAGADLAFTLRVTVPPDADPATPVTGGCVDTDANGTCDSAVPDVVLGTPLSGRVQLSTAQETITPGLTGTGLIRATATGALTGATVTVPLTGLPTGFSVIGAAGPTGATCTLGTTQVVCTGVTVAAGVTSVVSLTVRAAPGTAAGVPWTVTGITLSQGDQSVTGGGTIAVTGPPVAPLAVAVTGPAGTVRPGATTTMTVSVTNPGPSNATAATATVVAPANTTFGTLSGQAATNCTSTTSTLLTCTFDLSANAPALVWTIPLIVSATAGTGDTVSGGCVSLNGGGSCGDPVDVEAPEFSVGRPLIETTTMTVSPATIAAGDSGTAEVVVTATADNEALTLTIPLTPRPAGFTVTSATIGDAPCTVTADSIVCSDVTLTADQPLTVAIAIDVAETVAAGTNWEVAGLTLVNDADSTDRLTTQGRLARTTATGAAVTVTIGTPSVPKPAPGQTTVLPVTISNAGPGDADPYTTTILLPTGTSHGTLPAGCVEGATPRTVTCTVSLAAGETVDLAIPVIIDAGAGVGSTISGGCVDTDGNGTCGGGEDLAVPNLVVSAPVVDLTIEYADPAPTAQPGKVLLLKLPYSNNGSQNASDVTFLIDPPAGVTLTRAAVLLDAGTSFGGGSAAAADLIDATCEPAPEVDANAVRCTGPEAPIGASSELWLYMAVAKTAKAGKYPVRVEISTTSAEGNTVNNTAVAELTIAGRPGGGSDPDPDPANGGNGGNGGTGSDGGSGGTGNGGGGLAKTGQDLSGLLLLSVLLVVGGVAARVLGRNRNRRSGRLVR